MCAISRTLSHRLSGERSQDVEIRYEDENIWLTQRIMALLYDVETNTINYHIKKIFEDSELQEDSVIRKFRITESDRKNYDANHYNLQMCGCAAKSAGN